MAKELPRKTRADILRHTREAAEAADWLGIWALSLGFCAINLAAIAYFAAKDSVGASFILVGAAAIIAVILRVSGQLEKRRESDKSGS
ncbi:MAG TPA: hypothetical protein VFP60_03025 [Pseudolabrys sp.]|nr:hypothetical protein [Pseudolabrys sp.]